MRSACSSIHKSAKFIKVKIVKTSNSFKSVRDGNQPAGAEPASPCAASTAAAKPTTAAATLAVDANLLYSP
jgi:hypothetical protein